MDYSLLLGIHNLEKERNVNALDAYLDLRTHEQQQQQQHQPTTENTNTACEVNLSPTINEQPRAATRSNRSFNL